uniref:Trans-cinnamate 4-monooxygenase n=1 Tax=Ananas comosus var. bracteatus TaxID=296719 RepID=A0A6V7PDH8_ANACO|nr:unnamed protein product [Ananas comosus var. bracteatus]
MITMDLVLMEKALLGLFAAVTVAIVVAKLAGKRFRLPPGPSAMPVVGNWLQVGDDLNHRNLMAMARRFGDVFLLRMGVRNLVVVSTPELAREVLHTQGVEFGSRTRNVVLDIFTGQGQDMVFTVYGDHWRKMRRIMTVPFFTSKVVQQNRKGWEEEAARVVEDLKANAKAATEGVVVRRRLQLMMYNDMFRIMFDRRFESEEDPLFNKLKAANAERSRLSQSFEYNYGDFIPVLRPFLRNYLNKCHDLKDRRLKLFEDHFVQDRKKVMAQTGEVNCAMDHILEAERKGEINHDNVLYIVENINVAAIETTLWSIEWGIAELVNHPEIQSKLRRELDAVLGPDAAVTEPDLERLPYLQSVVKETLRLRMAIPLLVPHMNLSDAKLAGYDIPGEQDPRQRLVPRQRPQALEAARGVPAREVSGGGEEGGGQRERLPVHSLRGREAQLPGDHPRAAHHRNHARPPRAELRPAAAPGQAEIDTTEKPGQFSNQILKHATVVCRPRKL